jgi:uncharacterized repeat protein (TIGR01451 family)
MKWSVALGAAVSAVLFAAAPLAAQSTPACTDIVNRATATYTIGAEEFTKDSNPTSTLVAQLLDVSVVWQDAASITVSPGDVDKVLTFLVTNTGNAMDSFLLEGLSTLPGDDFNPVFVSIYLDSNESGTYEAGEDVLYVPGANEPALDAGESITVFMLNDIPPGLDNGNEGDSRLTATSSAGSGDPGTVIPGATACGADAVIGTSGGGNSDTGTYIVSNVIVGVVKSATVTDQFGGAQPIPGATITYTLTVSFSGSGTAEAVMITDSVPAYTTYAAGTLALNGASLTDALDGDAGDVGGTTAGVVTVSLGDIPAGSADQTIVFSVVIN